VSTVLLIVIIVAIVLAGFAVGAMAARNKRKLREAFGPEYEQVARQQGGRREADREILRRKHLHDKLVLHPIGAQDQELYASSWEHLQGSFIDDPALAVTSAEQLVAKVLDARGYPGDDPDEQLALISVDHAQSLADYRAAQEITQHIQEDSSSTSTEEMRQALVSYHVLFNEVLTASNRVDA
jgi:hypothetical protein